MSRCQASSTPRLRLAGMLLCAGLVTALPTPSTAAGRAYEYRNAWLTLRLIPRSPAQIRAFYEARGFPPAALDELAATCFITASVRNRSRRVIWHRLDDWRFRRDGRLVKRYRRDWWRERWQALGIRPGLRATFRWTLFPEALDFRPDEGEGGNLILPRAAAPLRIEAVFHTGPNGTGETLRITTEAIPCAED